MFESFFPLISLFIAAIIVERRFFAKRDLSTKTFLIFIGGLLIGMGFIFHGKEISNSGYQKVYQYVVADRFKENKYKIAQNALEDNKISLKEMQLIMPASSYGPIPSESQYGIKDDFKVAGLPKIAPLKIDKEMEWADLLYTVNSVLGLLFTLFAIIYLVSFSAQNAVHKYLNPSPVLFVPKTKFIFIFFSLSVLTTAILYLYPASPSSVQKVQAFVKHNKNIEKIQDLHERVERSSTVVLHDLYLFNSITDKIQTEQIKKTLRPD